MKRMHLFLLILFHSLLVPAQTGSPEANPQDPRLLLDQAAPFYVYEAQTTKPWHLTYSYQILGDDSKPSGEGKLSSGGRPRPSGLPGRRAE